MILKMICIIVNIRIRLILLSDEDSWPRANEIVREAFGLHLTKGSNHIVATCKYFDKHQMFPICIFEICGEQGSNDTFRNNLWTWWRWHNHF